MHLLVSFISNSWLISSGTRATVWGTAVLRHLKNWRKDKRCQSMQFPGQEPHPRVHADWERSRYCRLPIADHTWMRFVEWSYLDDWRRLSYLDDWRTLNMKYKDSPDLEMCARTVLSMLNNANASSVSMNKKGSKKDGQTLRRGGQTEQVIMLGAPKGGNSSLWKLKLQLDGEKLWTCVKWPENSSVHEWH